MRIAVISERWSERADEGLLKFVTHLVERLARDHQLIALYERGQAPSGLPAVRVAMGKGLVTPALRHELATLAPELALYVPSACATFNALLRCKRLERALPRAKVALISLQHRGYGRLARWLLPWVRPARLVVLSRASLEQYRRLGFAVSLVDAGVDLQRFAPVGSDARHRLRQMLGWPQDRRVVLHVGHLSAHRGLERLCEAARLPSTHVVMAASTATSVDPALVEQLRSAGVDLRREFFPQVEQLYQAADVYLFPVRDDEGSIAFPLSVLEAMACGLRVVTTRFGALGDHFLEGDGLVFLQDTAPLAGAVAAVEAQRCATRALVQRFGWDATVARLLAGVQGAAD